MSRSREEKLSEDLPEDTRSDIEDQYDRIDLIENLEPNDIIIVETTLDEIRFAGEITNVIDRDQHTVEFDVLAYNGPDFAEDNLGFIVVDRAGAEGSLGDWQGVPYTTTFPDEGHHDTWGDIADISVVDDADDAIEEVDE